MVSRIIIFSQGKHAMQLKGRNIVLEILIETGNVLNRLNLPLPQLPLLPPPPPPPSRRSVVLKGLELTRSVYLLIACFPATALLRPGITFEGSF